MSLELPERLNGAGDMVFGGTVFDGMEGTRMRSSSVSRGLALLLLVLSWGPATHAEDSAFRIVGYLSGRGIRKVDELELDKLTHLNLAFANPDQDGNLAFSGNADITPVVKKGHDAGLEVYISLAGGGRPDKATWESVLQPGKRAAFIEAIVGFVDRHELDGVDVDIESNLLPTIGNLYTPFVVALRDALHAREKGISTALGATRLHEAVSQEALEAYDFINVMVYDKTGIWRPNDIGQHSPYSYAVDALRFWTEDKKIPPQRLTLGVPFYGFDFKPPARYISFREIIAEDISLAYRDSVDSTYYNGIPTIVRKAELAKKRLGGVMIWELSQDARGELSLLRAVHQTILASGGPGGGIVRTFFRDEDGDGVGDPNRPIQAREAPDGYVERSSLSAEN